MGRFGFSPTSSEMRPALPHVEASPDRIAARGETVPASTGIQGTSHGGTYIALAAVRRRDRVSGILQRREVHALNIRIRACDEEQESLAVGKKLRVSVTCFFRFGLSWSKESATPGIGNLLKPFAAAEQDHAVAIPCAHCRDRIHHRLAQSQRCAASDLHATEFAAGEEHNRLAVGRPERRIRILSAGQKPGW